MCLSIIDKHMYTYIQYVPSSRTIIVGDDGTYCMYVHIVVKPSSNPEIPS